MEPQSPKLSLHLGPPWLVGEHNKEPDKPSELPDYIARLELELRKIESFQRELPLSVLLLNDAIGRLKEEVGRSYKKLRSGSTGDVDGDKKTWMSSAQLWSSDRAAFLQLSSKTSRDGAEDGQSCSYNDERGALSSFPKGSEIPPGKEDVDANKPLLAGAGLCLQVTSEPASSLNRVGGVRGGGENSSVPVLTDQVKLRYQSSPAPLSLELQGSRKRRRCWSPELHRRFVDALEKLGGSQVATPKQIRELMQVDGLTNDEVKSHLQKYRLHIRKLPSATTSLLKDKIFASYDYELEGSGGAAALKAEVSHSGSPEGPLHLATRSANCNSATSRCNSMEDDDEQRSDSHSWKGH